MQASGWDLFAARQLVRGTVASSGSKDKRAAGKETQFRFGGDVPCRNLAWEVSSARSAILACDVVLADA